jgi:STE24 endopeptidase
MCAADGPVSDKDDSISEISMGTPMVNGYFIFVLAAVVGFYLLDLVSELMNLGSLRPELPAEFAGVYDTDKYAQSQNYTRVTTRADMIQATASLLVFLTFWFVGGFGWLDERLGQVSQNWMVRGLCYMGVLYVASSMVSLPFEIYSTFVIEERFGFNKTTPAVFISDRIKSLLLTAALGAPLVASIMWIFSRFGDAAWLYGWIVVTAFTLIMAYLGPALILPLFYKLRPLPLGELKTAIEDMAASCKFPLAEVCQVDGSRRSTKANAFFTGFGRHKKIALFDTLVESHTVAELVAVLAHEIGHYKMGHVRKGMVLSIVQAGAVFFIMSLFLDRPAAAFKSRSPWGVLQ